MYIFSQGKFREEPNINLKIQTEILEQVYNTKFLVFYIDKKLTWNKHIDHCKNKISSGIYAINMAKDILWTNHLKILYYSIM